MAVIAGAWGEAGGGIARKAVSVLTEIEDEMRAAGVERWMTIRYGKVGHAWTYPTSAEYKEFEAVNAHDASFALYRQLGLVTDGLPAGARAYVHVPDQSASPPPALRHVADGLRVQRRVKSKRHSCEQGIPRTSR